MMIKLPIETRNVEKVEENAEHAGENAMENAEDFGLNVVAGVGVHVECMGCKGCMRTGRRSLTPTMCPWGTWLTPEPRCRTASGSEDRIDSTAAP